MESSLKANLDRPHWPVFLLFASPLIAALASFTVVFLLPDCGVDEPWWEAGHMRLAFLPGMLGLLPLVWLFSHKPKVKQAAGLAGLMGAAQFALPQAAVAYYSTVPGSGSQIGNPSCSISSVLLPWLVLVMIVMWILGILLGTTVLRATAR